MEVTKVVKVYAQVWTGWGIEYRVYPNGVVTRHVEGDGEAYDSHDYWCVVDETDEAYDEVKAAGLAVLGG